MTSTSPPVVFFDGYCGLCNGTVQQLIKLDRQRRLRYASLQGEAARVQLPPQTTTESVLFWSHGVLYDRSEAARHILLELGGGYRVLGHLLWLVPRFIADRVYDWVARHRYRWFGRLDACSIPTAEMRHLFLP